MQQDLIQLNPTTIIQNLQLLGVSRDELNSLSTPQGGLDFLTNYITQVNLERKNIPLRPVTQGFETSIFVRYNNKTNLLSIPSPTKVLFMFQQIDKKNYKPSDLNFKWTKEAFQRNNPSLQELVKGIDISDWRYLVLFPRTYSADNLHLRNSIPIARITSFEDLSNLEPIVLEHEQKYLL